MMHKYLGVYVQVSSLSFFANSLSRTGIQVFEKYISCMASSFGSYVDAWLYYGF